MKKMVIALSSLTMVLLLGSVSLATEIDFSGEVRCMYFTAESNGDLKEKTEGFAKLNVDGKVNDKLSLHTELIADGAMNEDKTTAPFYCDAAYVVYTTGFGTIKIGRYPFNVRENVDTMSYIVPELKKSIQIKTDIRISDKATLIGFITKNPETSDSNYQNVYQPSDPIYAVGAAWRDQLWGASAYYLNYKHNEHPNETTVNFKDEDCLALNLYLKPSPYSKIYFYTAENHEIITDTVKETAVLGFSTEYNPAMPLYGKVEYDFLNNDGLGGDKNPWGVMLYTRLTDNTTLEFRHSENSKAEIWEHLKLIITF
ncbi:MAG: hypothetical protein ACM3YE_04155 [Bacteroidota bacterium]